MPDKSRFYTQLQTINWREIISDYVLITIGAAAMGMGFNLFYIPNDIVSGGLSGLAIISHHFFNWPVGLTILVMNIPLFMAGLRWGGGLTTGIRTLYALVISSLVIDLGAAYTPAITHSPLLYVAYGGLLDGIGLGLVFRAQGTTGGTDIIARLLRHFFGWEISRSVFGANAIIIALAAVVFDLERAMYGIMVAAISAVVVDTVLAGGRRVRQAIIISDEWEAIQHGLLTDLQRGVTILHGQGGFTGYSRPVLLCIISRSEVAQIRRMVRQIDNDAFVIISTATEVWGEGFGAMESEL